MIDEVDWDDEDAINPYKWWISRGHDGVVEKCGLVLTNQLVIFVEKADDPNEPYCIVTNGTPQNAVFFDTEEEQEKAIAQMRF